MGVDGNNNPYYIVFNPPKVPDEMNDEPIIPGEVVLTTFNYQDEVFNNNVEIAVHVYDRSLSAASRSLAGGNPGNGG